MVASRSWQRPDAEAAPVLVDTAAAAAACKELLQVLEGTAGRVQQSESSPKRSASGETWGLDSRIEDGVVGRFAPRLLE